MHAAAESDGDIVSTVSEVRGPRGGWWWLKGS